jgi:hypothetical protein
LTSPPADDAAIARDIGSICVAATPAPKLAAEICRNLLREMGSLIIIPTFFLGWTSVAHRCRRLTLDDAVQQSGEFDRRYPMGHLIRISDRGVNACLSAREYSDHPDFP